MIAPFKGYLLGKTVFHIVVMLFIIVTVRLILVHTIKKKDNTVAHYGQTTMLQAGGRMATAATGAVTGGVGIAVQAGKQIGQKIVEQIQAAVQNAAASARTTAKIWGTGTALLMLPVLFILCVAVLISSSRGSATNVNLSADVIALMPQINEACQRHGISEYAPLVAAVMMQEIWW